MVSTGVYLSNNGNGFCAPFAVVGPYVYFGSGSAGSGTVSAVSGTTVSTILTGGANEGVVSPFTSHVIVMKGNELAVLSGFSVLVSYYAVLPSNFTNLQPNGIMLISGIGFNTSLSDVLVWVVTATDNSTVGVFYIQESQINGTTSATLATSFVPIAPVATSSGNNMTFTDIALFNGVYWMVATGGGCAPRGAVVVLSSTNLVSWTSVLSLSGANTVSVVTDTFHSFASASPDMLAFLWWNPANQLVSLVYIPSGTTLPSYVNLNVLIPSASISNYINLGATILGSLVICFIGHGNGGLPAGGSSVVLVYDFTNGTLNEVFPSQTSVSVSTNVTFANGVASPQVIFSSVPSFLFGLQYIGATTSSSIMYISFDNPITLSISLPASIPQGQTITVQVYTTPATSNITIKLYNFYGTNEMDFTGFGGTLLGSGVTNTSGIASISFVVPSQSTLYLTAIYDGG